LLFLLQINFINVILSSFPQAIPRIEGLKKGDIKKRNTEVEEEKKWPTRTI
jgi:hypothetical protein